MFLPFSLPPTAHVTVRKPDEPENERFVTLSPVSTEKWSCQWWSVTDAFLSLCSWGLVQPGILSVPELCHHVAEAWVSAAVLASCLLKYKQENPGMVKITCILWNICVIYSFYFMLVRYESLPTLTLQSQWNWKIRVTECMCVVALCQFCILTCGVFSGLAMVGRCLTGLVLSYSAGKTHTTFQLLLLKMHEWWNQIFGVINVRTRCTGRDGVKPSSKLRSHC